MHSIYTARKKEEEDLRKQQACALDRAIHSQAHREITDALSSSHRARVEDWMTRTLAAEPPPLHAKPLTMADLSAQPYKFYRTSRRPARNGATASGSQSARSAGGVTARSTWSTTEDSKDRLPEHLQMSATKYQTEAERLADYERSDLRAHLQGQGVYEDPHAYTFRIRAPAAEIAGPMVFKPQNERARIEEAITARDVGGRAFPWEQPNAIPHFREENKAKWRAGHFAARLPPLPLFSVPSPTEEKYGGGVIPPSYRAASPTTANIAASKHSERFSSHVPSDRFVPLPPSHPSSPRPPVQAHAGRLITSNSGCTNTLSAGLNSSGIYGQGGPSHWKSALALANHPRGESVTAQQLVHTYRRHLAY